MPRLAYKRVTLRCHPNHACLLPVAHCPDSGVGICLLISSLIFAIGRIQQYCNCFDQKVCSADLAMTWAAVYLPGAFGVTYSTLPTTVLAHLVPNLAFSRSATSSLYTLLSVWPSTMSRCAACASAVASVVQAEIACPSQAHYCLLAYIVEVAFPLLLVGTHSSQLHQATQLLCTSGSNLSEHQHTY